MNNALRKQNKPKTRPTSLIIDLVDRDRVLLTGQAVLLRSSTGQLVECVLSPCRQEEIADAALRARWHRAAALKAAIEVRK